MYHLTMMILIQQIISTEFYFAPSVQARELTTLQSILQDQIESQGKHMFKEGTVVIPEQLSYSNAYYSLQLASTFGGEDIVLNQFFNSASPVTITGSTWCQNKSYRFQGWNKYNTTYTLLSIYSIWF